ncbi:Prefoldin, subunit 4 [Leucosporidium creatinivorum]|uniref:Prefoldin subunit 4 n=1 Tax=Leucosporidium creatinivorum TaxID=106004 RepID=A0A1Y2FZI4_9BASI|nr:Prefoldin, subunit 4 [Leucosporidium creatinivorum]
MRMLENDDADADTLVTLEDQRNINAFSKLNSRSDEVTAELESIKKQLEDVEEVETEMELMDEEEEVMYKLDSSFLRLPAGEVLTLLQASLEKLRSQTETLEKERDECEEGMTKLKAVLYAKFGTSINLEKGD